MKWKSTGHMFHLMIKVLVNLHLWMEKRSRYLYFLFHKYRNTGYQEKPCVSGLNVVFLHPGFWMFVCTRQLVVWLVSITFCVLSENGICIDRKREYGDSVWGENVLMKIIWRTESVPLVLEFHFRWNACWRNNHFQANLSYNPVFWNIQLCA